MINHKSQQKVFLKVNLVIDSQAPSEDSRKVHLAMVQVEFSSKMVLITYSGKSCKTMTKFQ